MNDASPLPDHRRVDVWTVRLACENIDAQEALLAGQERERAERFVYTRDRTRFVLRRAALRRILARYLDVPPERVRLATGEFGKPCFAERRAPVAFNASSSGAIALIAIGAAAVGVDVEETRTMADLEGVATLVLSPAERALWDGLDPAGRLAAGNFRRITSGSARTVLHGFGSVIRSRK